MSDSENNKLPKQITLKQTEDDTPWYAYSYDPETGSLLIQEATQALTLQATAQPLTDCAVTLELNGMTTDWVAGTTIKEGKNLRLRFTLPNESDYRLPNSIQVWQDGEALSTDDYDYSPSIDINNGEYHLVLEVEGDITIKANAIGTGQHEVQLDLENIKTDLTTTAYQRGSHVKIHLIPNTGYTLPETLTVKMGENNLTAEEDYTDDHTTGQFSLAAITDNLVISGEANPIDFRTATLKLINLKATYQTKSVIYGTDFYCELTPEIGYSLPKQIQVEMNGQLLRADYTYWNGGLEIPFVTGPITITAEAPLKEQKTFEGAHEQIYVDAEGSVSVTLNGVTTNEMTIKESSNATIQVTNTSTIQQLNNYNTATLTGNIAPLSLESYSTKVCLHLMRLYCCQAPM